MKKMVLLPVLALAILTGGPAFSKEKNDETEVKIYGYIQALPKGLLGDWKVNNKVIRVDKNTGIEEEYGKVKVGAYVKVEGIIKGKEILAEEIEVKKSREENKEKNETEKEGK